MKEFDIIVTARGNDDGTTCHFECPLFQWEEEWCIKYGELEKLTIDNGYDWDEEVYTRDFACIQEEKASGANNG